LVDSAAADSVSKAVVAAVARVGRRG
jgi:hypothetical protein